MTIAEYLKIKSGLALGTALEHIRRFRFIQSADVNIKIEPLIAKIDTGYLATIKDLPIQANFIDKGI